MEGFKKKEIYIGLNENKECIGFMRIDLNGAFSMFPMLRLIAIKQRFRNKGIGKILLNYYFEIGFKNSKKIFLMVSDFNKEAKKLYESIGFIEVGLIPDLYKKGIAEFLMMKCLKSINHFTVV